MQDTHTHTHGIRLKCACNSRDPSRIKTMDTCTFDNWAANYKVCRRISSNFVVINLIKSSAKDCSRCWSASITSSIIIAVRYPIAVLISELFQRRL